MHVNESRTFLAARMPEAKFGRGLDVSRWVTSRSLITTKAIKGTIAESPGGPGERGTQFYGANRVCARRGIFGSEADENGHPPALSA